MNPPTDYHRLTVVLPSEKKQLLIKYSELHGQNLTWIVNRLISLLIAGKVKL